MATASTTRRGDSGTNRRSPVARSSRIHGAGGTLVVQCAAARAAIGSSPGATSAAGSSDPAGTGSSIVRQTTTVEPPDRPDEPRQRWRLVVRRDAGAPELNQRDLAAAWIDGLQAAALPVAHADPARTRPRISFGAPLPISMPAEAELVDVVLTESLPAWQVRAAIQANLPAGWALVDLHDVWLAGPALAGQVAAADYRIDLGGTGAAEVGSIRDACAALLAAGTLPRERRKGETIISYDLRPLLVDVTVSSAGPPPVVIARTRFHPVLGTGRPEEVISALADAVGAPIEAASIVRERVVLADELD